MNDPAANDLASATVAAALERHRDRPGGLLPLLHDVQQRLGYIPDRCVAEIAAGMSLSRAEVHGVITYYHHFRRRPPAKVTIEICLAESCRSMGAVTLLGHVERKLGCRLHQRTADGGCALEPVYCLGQCASSPAMLVGGVLHARVTPARFDRALEAACRTDQHAGDALAPAPRRGAKVLE